VFYQIVTHNENETLSIIGERVQTTVPPTHPNYATLVEYLQGSEEHDEEHVERLLDLAYGASQRMYEISERVRLVNGTLYFDGDMLDNVLSRHIVRMVREGDDAWEGLVRFMENLAQNPSRQSRLHLFKWLNFADFTITREGMFIAYKGVTATNENLSSHAGSGAIVNGVPVDGYRQVPNPIGGVIEMPRSMVDPERSQTCSVGLHVGSYEYAKGFGERLLTVEVNPRDVVSVPHDESDQKMRVCRYKVIQASDTDYRGLTTFPAGDDDQDTLDYSDQDSDTVFDSEEEAADEPDAYSEFEGEDEEDDFEDEENWDDWEDEDEQDEAEYGNLVVSEEDTSAVDTGAEDDRFLTSADLNAAEHEDWAVVEAAQAEEAAQEQAAQAHISPLSGSTIFDLAEKDPDLRKMLENTSMGHKAVAEASGQTSETAVRRYRKANGIVFQKGGK
jgi:hypothetical protein